MIIKEYKETRKGQVSFFIILGIVLLIIGIFVFYLTTFTTKERTKREVITTQQMPTELQEINNYVVSCLDRVSQDGLELIGKRGGMIITYEGGTFNPIMEGRDFISDSNGEMINYAIINIIVIPYVDIQGVNILPRVGDGTGNIYKNLKGYINNALIDPVYGKGCLEDIQFKDVFNAKGFDIDSGSIRIDLDITNDDTRVHLNYPLAITNKATGEKRELKDFYVTKKIRLRKMHDFLEGMITREVYDKDFNLAAGQVASSLGIAGFDDNFKIEDISPGATVTQDDIIVVIDEASLLKGRPYSFRFARMNRKPIADFTHPSSGLSVNFDSSSSLDPDEDSIIRWSWDFDSADGVGEDSTQEKPTHTYSSSNTYSVNLKVEDIHNKFSDYKEKQVIVT